jgi:hypothetical protein
MSHSRRSLFPLPPVVLRLHRPAPSPKIVILDKNLRKALAIEKVKSGRTINQMLFAEAHLRNRSNTEITVQAQTVYRDAQGNPLNPEALAQEPGSWTVLVIPIKSSVPYRSQSLNPVAQNATIELRFLK